MNASFFLSPNSSRGAPNLDEVLAAAEMILGGTEEVRETKPKRAGRKRKNTRQQKQSKRKKTPLRRSKRRKVEIVDEEEDEGELVGPLGWE